MLTPEPVCKTGCADRMCANPECDRWFGSTSKDVKLCPDCRFKPEIRDAMAKGWPVEAQA